MRVHGARYYAAEIGRFVQPDSMLPDIYDPQQLNRYAYVRNNPLKYVDPSGNALINNENIIKTIDSVELYIDAVRDYGYTLTRDWSELNSWEIRQRIFIETGFYEVVVPIAGDSVADVYQAATGKDITYGKPLGLEERALSVVFAFLPAVSGGAAKKLDRALLGEVSGDIAKHSFLKHADEFVELGIKNEEQLSRFAIRVVENSDKSKVLNSGGKAWLDRETGTIVIYNPKQRDGLKGTIYRRGEDAEEFFNYNVK